VLINTSASKSTLLNYCKGSNRKKHLLYYLSMARNTPERNLRALPNPVMLAAVVVVVKIMKLNFRFKLAGYGH
jgi:hypothetical protein